MKLNAVERFKPTNRKIIAHLIEDGWEIDGFGHATKEVDGVMRRYLFKRKLILKQFLHVIKDTTTYDTSRQVGEWITDDILHYYKS